MDDIRIYNRILSDAEIILLSNETSVSFMGNNFINDINIFQDTENGIVLIDLGALVHKVQILISDMTGKLIMKENHESGQVFRLRLDTTPGLYVISVFSEDKGATFKLFKN